MTASTTDAAFFESMYTANSDPWQFAQSEYEQSRYAATIAALGTRRYDHAFEPGCSIGELTARLAERCEHVLAMDISATAVSLARIRCQAFSNVTFQVGSLPHLILDSTPDRTFDLIVFSEIGYYFEQPALRDLGNWMVNRLSVSGTLLAVHWLGHSQDHLLSGDSVHKVLATLDGLRLDHSERHAHFRLDRWVRT